MELKAFDYEKYKNSGNITYDTDFEYATLESLTRLGKDWYSIKLRDNTWYRFCFRINGCKGREIILISFARIRQSPKFAAESFVGVQGGLQPPVYKL